MKPCKTYRGVKILRGREEIPGSCLRELKDGRFVPCKPPSSEHQGLKDFMISQLEESIRFDKMIDETFTKVNEVTGREWLQKQIALCLWDVEYHTENNLKEIARVGKRNLWIKQLRESLK